MKVDLWFTQDGKQALSGDVQDQNKMVSFLQFRYFADTMGTEEAAVERRF